MWEGERGAKWSQSFCLVSSLIYFQWFLPSWHNYKVVILLILAAGILAVFSRSLYFRVNLTTVAPCIESSCFRSLAFWKKHSVIILFKINLIETVCCSWHLDGGIKGITVYWNWAFYNIIIIMWTYFIWPCYQLASRLFLNREWYETI